VDRPVENGDFVSIDLAASVDGEAVEDAQASGISYEVGSGSMLDGLDEALTGLSPGESVTFSADLAGGVMEGVAADVEVKVNSVKVKELPVLDDEFAQSASEFDTIGELRAGTRKQLEDMRKTGQAGQARERALDAVLDQVDIPLPERVVDAEIEQRRHNLDDRLVQAGMTMEDYLQGSGQTADGIEEQFDTDARRSIKAGFILDKLAVQEELGVESNELNSYITQQAYRLGVTPDQLAQQITESGQVNSVVADVLRTKALTLIAEKATVTDESGNPVDILAITRGAGPAEDDDEADGDAGEAAETSAETADAADETADETTDDTA
jgi:trigger factor